MQSRNQEVNIQEIDQGPKINQGGFSIIMRGKFRGTDVVIKKIFDPVITDDLMEEFRNEVEMLSSLRHPNVVLMMGYC